MGCWCQPSPALITVASVHAAICAGTPDDRWRTTTASMPIASIVSMVSRTDSPLFTDDDDTAKLIVSADRRLAAVSKLNRVRVESS